VTKKFPPSRNTITIFLQQDGKRCKATATANLLEDVEESDELVIDESSMIDGTMVITQARVIKGDKEEIKIKIEPEPDLFKRKSTVHKSVPSKREKMDDHKIQMERRLAFLRDKAMSFSKIDFSVCEPGSSPPADQQATQIALPWSNRSDPMSWKTWSFQNQAQVFGCFGAFRLELYDQS